MLGTLATLAGLEIRDSARRKIRVGGLLLLAAGLIVGGLAYGLSALAIVLGERYGALNANLMIGGGLLGVALLVALAAWFVNRQPRSADTRAALGVATASLALSVGRSLAPSLLKVTPLVLIAGLIVGRALGGQSPSARR